MGVNARPQRPMGIDAESTRLPQVAIQKCTYSIFFSSSYTNWTLVPMMT